MLAFARHSGTQLHLVVCWPAAEELSASCGPDIYGARGTTTRYVAAICCCCHGMDGLQSESTLQDMVLQQQQKLHRCISVCIKLRT